MFTVAAILDINPTFNSVWHEGLLFKLRISGMVPYPKLIANAYTNVNTSIATPHQISDGLAALFNKWKLNTTETETKMFTLRKIPQNITRIHINQNPVAWTLRDTSIKYFGLGFYTLGKTLTKAYA